VTSHCDGRTATVCEISSFRSFYVVGKSFYIEDRDAMFLQNAELLSCPPHTVQPHNRGILSHHFKTAESLTTKLLAWQRLHKQYNWTEHVRMELECSNTAVAVNSIHKDQTSLGQCIGLGQKFRHRVPQYPGSEKEKNGSSREFN
jgi:hypothetical protein